MKEESFRNVHIFKSMQELSDYAVKEWHRVGCSAIRKRGQFFSALSGGKTPRMVYENISIKDTLNDYGKVVLFQVDERYVDRKDEKSNFKMIIESFTDCRWMNSELLISIPVDSGSALKDAEIYENRLKSISGLCKKETPVFDLVFLGLGEDGHTASLFSVNIDEKRNVCETVAPDGLQRITLSMNVLKNSRNIVMIASGVNKAGAVRDLVYGLNSETPAYKTLEKHSGVKLLFDDAAASLLLR